MQVTNQQQCNDVTHFESNSSSSNNNDNNDNNGGSSSCSSGGGDHRKALTDKRKHFSDLCDSILQRIGSGVSSNGSNSINVQK